MLQFTSGLRRSFARADPNGGRHAGQHTPVGAAEERKDGRHWITELKQLNEGCFFFF